MGLIKVLDQNMINMIAAGEVIERPASVVKELMENSIDAGCSKITVEIADGGRKLISITDNGCGMDPDDLQAAFLPHSTSKLAFAEDLQNISTLGFRGEALASIASISQLKAISRTKDSQTASSIEIDCGSVNPIAVCSGNYGTTVEVRDIFYRLPARRKFLKTANTEAAHITEQFTRIALVRTDIEMTLIKNGKKAYQLAAGQNIIERISGLFSDEIAANLIAAGSCEKNLNIRAFLGRPEISRTASAYQYVFLNGRFIRDKTISHAVREAYRGHLEQGRFPVVFLFLEMPFEDVDVNVHPAKMEVRFYNSNLVHSQVLACIREKLLSTDMGINVQMPPTAINDFSRGYSSSPNDRTQSVTRAVGEFLRVHSNSQQLTFKPSAKTHRTLEPLRYDNDTVSIQKNFIQIHDSYIVSQTTEGFVIIDQHALHERIIYETLKKKISSGNLESQKLLVPEVIEVTAAQADLIENNNEVFAKLGIELSPFGPSSYAVHAFAVLLSRADQADFICDVLDLLGSQSSDFNASGMLDEILNMAACKAAVKAGMKLTDSEIGQMISDSEQLELYERCPHGRPTTIKFSIDQLEKQFKRT